MNHILNYTIIIVVSPFLFQACISKPASKSEPRSTLSFSKATCIARVTGDAIDSIHEYFPNSNNTPKDFNIGGTDLGIIWEMNNGEYGIFFGDTYDRTHSGVPVPSSGGWRSNVLAFSNDRVLDDGLSFSGMATDTSGSAREIIYGAKDVPGLGDWTSIPTGAICANEKEYVHYMNVKEWGGWTTNYSGLYRSADNGLNWAKCDSVNFGSDSNFAQVGYYKKDGYVYMIGTKSGRSSAPRLSRFLEIDIENKSQYEYWNNEAKIWVKGDEAKATNLFEDTVGELSIIYHDKTQNWILTYFCSQRYNISVRYTKDITTSWSDPQELANGQEFPQLYGSYIHPLSVDDDWLYFLMSQWQPYNVYLMKSDIK